MTDHKTQVAMANSLTRALINRSSPDGFDVQMTWLTRTTPDIENFQPQGLHFRLPAKSEGVAIAPGGIADNAVIVGASKRSALPADALLEGEGGLHYLGDYKVFLAEDGTLSLGSKAATDFVALGSLVDTRVAALQAKLDALITNYAGHTHLYAPGPGTPTATAPIVVGSGPPVLGVQESVCSENVRSD